MKATPQKLKIGRATVSLSNPDKVLYPETGFTKRQVADYYLRIAATILPHLKGRPVTLKRYPNGVDEPFFYQKQCPTPHPTFVKTTTVPSRGRTGEVNYCLIPNAAALAWLANLASLELHTMLYKAARRLRPTMMVFDLDPGPPADILACIRVARRMRDMFEHLGLQAFPKTSGGKGLHLCIPLNTPVTFEQTKTFAHTTAELLEREFPDEVLAVMSRDKRSGKVFVDWSQNDEHKTTVCVYSLRARAHPTVSTPVTWDELDSAARKKNPASLVFEAEDVIRRIEKLGDLFDPVRTLKQRLPAMESESE